MCGPVVVYFNGQTMQMMIVQIDQPRKTLQQTPHATPHLYPKGINSCTLIKDRPLKTTYGITVHYLSTNDDSKCLHIRVHLWQHGYG
jgi:hypothetical protein